MSKTEIGYFQVPNFVFNLGLSHYAILVLMNLIRRADRKQSGMCYPSLKTIAEDCSVKSENTIRKAIKELEEQKLVTVQNRGRKLFFIVSPRIYDSIDEARNIYNKYGTLKGHSASDEGIDEIDSTEDIQNYEIQSLDEGVPSPNEFELPQDMSTNEDSYNKKSSKEKDKSFFEDKNCQTKEKKDKFDSGNNSTSPTSGSEPKLTEVNKFYYHLSEKNKLKFDALVKKLQECDRHISFYEERRLKKQVYIQIKENPRLLESFNS